jgi:channel protein (hemolysin III family)
MVGAFAISDVDHMTPILNLSVCLRRADHELVFLRTAYSYAPLVWVIKTPFSHVVLAGVWIAAHISFFSKLVFSQSEGESSLLLYFTLSRVIYEIGHSFIHSKPCPIVIQPGTFL